MRSSVRRNAALAVVVLSGLLPATASATFPGSNGAITIGVRNFDTAKPSTTRLFSETGEQVGEFGLDPSQMRSFGWSADGTRLVGYYGPYPANPAKPAGVYVFTPSTGDMVRVYNSYAYMEFLPDGRLLFVRNTNELWTVNADGTGLQRVLPGVTVGPDVNSVSVAPDGATAYYVVPGNKFTSVADALWAIDLTTGIKRQVYTHVSNGGSFPTVGIMDIAPNAKSLLLSIEITSEGSGGDTVSPARMFMIGTDGTGLRQIPTAFGQRPGGRFSPDGTSIFYSGGDQLDSTAPVGEMESHIVGVDGSGDRRILTWPAPSHAGFTGVSWQPGPGLSVDLAGDQLDGDLVELDLTLNNVVSSPFGNLRYDEGGATGLVLNTAPYSPEFRAQYTVLGGPTPTLLSEIAAGQQSTHQYLLGLDKPGNVQVRAKVYGTSPTTGEIIQEATTYIVARNRDLADWEQAATVAGAYSEYQGAIQDPTQKVWGDTWGQIRKAVKSTVPKNQFTLLTRASPRERALARTLGVPQDTFAFLPNDKATADKALRAFLKAGKAAQTRVIKKHLGAAYKFSLETPFEYWAGQVDHLRGRAPGTIPLGTALYDEGAYWSGKTKDGFVNAAYFMADNPPTTDLMDQVVGSAIVKTETYLRGMKDATPGKLRRLADKMADDPVGAATIMGDVFSTVHTEIGMGVAEALLTPSKAGVARGIENAGVRVEQFLGRFVGGATESAAALDVVQDASVVGRTLKTAAQLGMPDRDVTRWSAIVAKLEAAAQKLGVKIDAQLSFRPRNTYSAAIEDGVGKNMFVKKIKAGDDIDVILGMDPSGLGKGAVYNPKRPADFASYPKPKQVEMEQRIKDMRAGYQEWFNPKSDIGKAQRKGGVTVSSSIKDNTVTKIKMKVSGVEKNGTIAVRYDELIVDGQTIVKRGAKPRWMVSDYDGNAFLQVNGKDIPAAVKGFLETELMRLQRSAGATVGDTPGMAVSYHGFTKNAFDLSDISKTLDPSETAYRRTFKFLLEGLSDADAKKALDLYLKKYGDGDDYKKLLGEYTSGGLVIQVTRDGARTAQGY